MVSKYSVREIDPWYEEANEIIKGRIEPHFGYSILHFIS